MLRHPWLAELVITARRSALVPPTFLEYVLAVLKDLRGQASQLIPAAVI
jgi:hypothetical protein